MFCIFAFIVFLILGIFSAKYRGLAKKSWGCVWTKLTFKACDISLQQEMRAVLVGRFVITHPRFARFLTRWIDKIAFVFVALSVWSLLVVINSGINYYVYDTCNPGDPESCTLSSGACGIGSYRPGFFESLTSGEILVWVKNETTDYFDKYKRIPDRMKDWKAEEYISDTATYYYEFDSSKPTALEMIDPGCIYCAKLFNLSKETDFVKKYNFTYILYPIPNPDKEGEYKFKNSYLVAKFIEASKSFSKKESITPLDWQLLEKMYTGKDEKGREYQSLFNEKYTATEAENKLMDWVIELGYDKSAALQIKEKANSSEIVESIKKQADIVNNEVRTVKIPTIIFDERRYDRMIDEKTLLK